MLKAKWNDKIPCREIGAKTNIKDVVKFAAKQKWKWADHVARLNDNRWTKRIKDWHPRSSSSSSGARSGTGIGGHASPNISVIRQLQKI